MDSQLAAYMGQLPLTLRLPSHRLIVVVSKCSFEKYSCRVFGSRYDDRTRNTCLI